MSIAASLCLFLVTAAPAVHMDISSLRLSFGRSREVRIVSRGEAISTLAEISVAGSGSLSGVWSVAGPMGPGDDAAAFKVIGTFTDSSAGEAVLRESPVLPTDETGSYAVRLTVSIDGEQRISKIIKYFVGERPPRDLLGGKTEVPDELSASHPPDNVVAPTSVLSWDPVPGSLAYQLELFDKSGDEKNLLSASRINACIMRLASTLNRPPLVGLMVPAYRTEARLDELAGDFPLMEGHSYLWRIVAIDRDGRALCESPLREFVFSSRP